MSYHFKNAITKENIVEFHQELDNVGLKELTEFLKKYNLSIERTHLTYDNNGVELKIHTSYSLSNGEKPWAEKNALEYFSHVTWAPKNLPPKIIGSSFVEPSKRYPREEYEIVDFNNSSTYPIITKRKRDGKEINFRFFSNEAYFI